MKNQSTTNQLLIILSFIAVYFVWGTTYMAIVIGLESFTPFFMASIRFLIAGILLVAYSLIKGEGIPNRSALLKNTVIGLIVLAGGQGLLIWSEQYIASGYASVLVATLPIWYVLIDRQHWKFYFGNPLIIIGILLGILGIVILFWNKLDEPLPTEQIKIQIVASLTTLGGALCWVIGTLYNRSRPAPGSIFKNLGWQLLAGAVICLFIGLMNGEYSKFQWETISANSWMALIYLALAGSIIAFVAYTWLLNRVPSAIVGTYAYINPIVAVFLGWLWLNEKVNALQLVGTGIVLVSAVLININRVGRKDRR